MIVAANAAVCRLLQTIDGITIVPLQEATLHEFDVRCSLLSLPRAFATYLETIPDSAHYLRAEPSQQARWSGLFGGKALQVGIVWAGNPATRQGRFRSPRLASITPLFDVPGIDFIALQAGPGRRDCTAHPLLPHILDLGREVADLADTAAIMAGLDLMISSCTAPLHLAGALGVPCWAMIPFAPHFLWLLGRHDSPWYPTLRLYRQEQPGLDWIGVVRRMVGDLTALVESRSKTELVADAALSA
ncbi:MAG: hypothetical protein ACJ8AI_22635 [Rhodopila sp.]